ncbi:MAG: hypothetical protein IPM29_25390 [Planctomycetes bacterium]|nr:hypothetical protein [Planctomycetota bacterium]
MIGDHDDPLLREPWFHEAVAQARIRRGGRVLQIFAFGDAQSRVLLAKIGDEGTLTVVDPDRYRAGRIMELDHSGLAVLGYDPDGEESFGSHDALVSCPARLTDWPLDRWSSLALHNLRPGGRMVLDLPGQPQSNPIHELWQEIGAPVDRLAGWSGPSAKALSRVLTAGGLREVETAATTHLVRFPSVSEAARWCCDKLAADDDVVAGLHLAMARRFATDGELELVFHRTRILAMR